MALRTGKVIIAKNIKLDKSYKDVLSYTESQMLTLINSKKVAETTNCSFIKVGDNIIDTNFSYSDALKCNYMAMQNPYYSNKWFFAFIDEVEYISDGNARIHYTIDEFATWFDYWNPKECFVVREHVNDDTIGLHTVPENLETGDFVVNATAPISFSDFNLDLFIVIGITQPVTQIESKQTRNYNGLFSGLYYLAFQNSTNADKFLRGMDNEGLGERVYSIFVLPRKVINPNTSFTFDLKDVSGIVAYNVPDSATAVPFDTTSISINSSLNGYTPKNNKLKTWPFNYVMVTNDAGTEVVYKYEDFANNTPKFKPVGSICPGGSIKLLPVDYKTVDFATDNNGCAIYGMNAGKYPTCSWNTDVYTNWLTQNSINNTLSVIGGVATIIAGAGMAATGVGAPEGAALITGGSVALGGGVSIMNTAGQIYQQSFTPNQAKGNTNSGDIQFSGKMNGFRYFQMSMRSEYAKICDDYFNRLGYKVNRIKLPNQRGRHYWNYVQIGNEENIGYSTNTAMSVPASSMDIINQIYRRGVTLWHDHDQLGNYGLTNNIL